MSLLIATAAVRPNVRSSTFLADPGARLSQYKRAIGAMANLLADSDWQLAVVETTGSVVEDLVPAGLRNRSLLCSYAPTTGALSRGKGAVELEAIEFSLDYWGIDHASSVYKLTGRLTLTNAAAVLQPLNKATVACRRTAGWTYVDTRLLGATAGIWRTTLCPVGLLSNDARGLYVEHVLAGELARQRSLGSVHVDAFTERPLLDGQSASTGGRYSATRSRLRAAVLGPIEQAFGALADRKQI